MKKLDFSFELEFSLDVAAALCDTLQCGDDDLDKSLQPYAKAAMLEYTTMLAGQALTSVAELRERRLLEILLALPAAEFPNDEQIARLFNLTAAQGRALLRATLSRHRSRLHKVMHAVAKRFVQTVTDATDKDVEAHCPNAVVIEMLNGQLAATRNTLTPIKRLASAFDTYVVRPGTNIALKELYA